MLQSSYLQLWLLLAILTAVKCCIVEINKATWRFNPNIGEEFHFINSVADCKSKCLEGPGNCKGYTFTYNGVVGSCYIFQELIDIHFCETCYSGVTYEIVAGACEFDEDNELTEVNTESAEECYQQCVKTTECEAFTWYDPASEFPKVCYLYTSCLDIASCSGCSSGKLNCIEASQCFDYNILDEELRNWNVESEDDDNKFGDLLSSSNRSPRWMGAGYYRMVPPAGTMIPERKPHFMACSTYYGGYLDEGSHPDDYIEVERTVRFASDLYTINITITKCPGEYYVYYLPNTPSYGYRYCARSTFN